ncbi:unknown [[Mannheimia] succiniciproducens MBEL55E]|uniref:Uncharacterized protein n=1 Tax=Mannheimia succiniciproducens (strain KCTC 0769BP / MBEL55E) TaxID=221988 RepID=Q65S56_MANSM|nr:unknown [[Mannheimia] succiniciproducens MBEL55E]
MASRSNKVFLGEIRLKVKNLPLKQSNKSTPTADKTNLYQTEV